jgi:hypothetical protein
MAENLKVTHYCNGDPIPNVSDNSAWSILHSGARCYYNNDSAMYVGTYGVLYNWYAVKEIRGLAPTGWHIPSNDEWGANAANIAALKVLTGGWRNSKGLFFDIGIRGYWWSSNYSMPDGAWAWRTSSKSLAAADLFWASAVAVRCIKD